MQTVRDRASPLRFPVLFPASIKFLIILILHASTDFTIPEAPAAPFTPRALLSSEVGAAAVVGLFVFVSAHAEADGGEEEAGPGAPDEAQDVFADFGVVAVSLEGAVAVDHPGAGGQVSAGCQ